MGGSSRYHYAIAALVLVCLLRKVEAQSECRCIRVMCVAAEAAASLCSAVYYAYCCIQLSVLYIILLGCKGNSTLRQIRTSYIVYNYDLCRTNV